MKATPTDVVAPLDGGALEALAGLFAGGRRALVLTGAGCSTASGIPDYRDATGQWKRTQPITYQTFVGNQAARQRYWARSLVGWRRMRDAAPNGGHHALVRLERLGYVHWLVTQNVDGLHQRAGSRHVTDLHGRLDVVECLQCGGTQPRARFQEALERLNPGWRTLWAQTAPDGDADLDGVDFSAFRVPACAHCEGVLKPGVVFFGESVPRERVATAKALLGEADLLLVVGSSLMVWSGYRFVRAAQQWGMPVAAVNLGRTRADGELDIKVSAPCDRALTALCQQLDS